MHNTWDVKLAHLNRMQPILILLTVCISLHFTIHTYSRILTDETSSNNYACINCDLFLMRWNVFQTWTDTPFAQSLVWALTWEIVMVSNVQPVWEMWWDRPYSPNVFVYMCDTWVNFTWWNLDYTYNSTWTLTSGYVAPNCDMNGGLISQTK